MFVCDPHPISKQATIPTICRTQNEEDGHLRLVWRPGVDPVILCHYMVVVSVETKCLEECGDFGKIFWKVAMDLGGLGEVIYRHVRQLPGILPVFVGW